jgi:hypothetical protein
LARPSLLRRIEQGVLIVGPKREARLSHTGPLTIGESLRA